MEAPGPPWKNNSNGLFLSCPLMTTHCGSPPRTIFSIVVMLSTLFFIRGVDAFVRTFILTTPTAEAVGFFFANIPLTNFQKKDAEAKLRRTTLERKTAFQEGKVCANYAVLSAILFIFLGLSLGCLVSCLFFFDK